MRTGAHDYSGEAAGSAFTTVSDLARQSAQDARTAGVFLVIVLVGVTSELATGVSFHGTGLVRLPLLASVLASFAVSVTLVARSRVALLRALGELRSRIGAPVDPSAPWTPSTLDAPITAAVLDRELRRLTGAAHRCCALAAKAQAWAATTGLLFAFWTLAWVIGH
ncbi:MAG TPA: hypothetical protein VH912_03350 [Streptosporangiaceae bacterium]|jgi:hypothetical protein